MSYLDTAKLDPVFNAIDTGKHTESVRLITNLQKTYGAHPWLLALKLISLNRMNDEVEFEVTIKKLQSVEVDVNTVNFLTHAFRTRSDVTPMLSICDKALKASPKDEDLVRQVIPYYVRVQNFSKLQQVCMTLYLSSKNAQYLHYSAIYGLLANPSLEQPSKVIELNIKMLERQYPDLHTMPLPLLQLYIRLQFKQDKKNFDKLQLLQASPDFLSGAPEEQACTVVQFFCCAGKLDEALKYAKARMLANLDNWRWIATYIYLSFVNTYKCFLSLPPQQAVLPAYTDKLLNASVYTDDLTFDSTLNPSLWFDTLVQEFRALQLEHPKVRSIDLAFCEVSRVCLHAYSLDRTKFHSDVEHNITAAVGSLPIFMLAYYRKYGSKQCFYEDLQVYFKALPVALPKNLLVHQSLYPFENCGIANIFGTEEVQTSNKSILHTPLRWDQLYPSTNFFLDFNYVYVSEFMSSAMDTIYNQVCRDHLLEENSIHMLCGKYLSKLALGWYDMQCFSVLVEDIRILTGEYHAYQQVAPSTTGDTTLQEQMDKYALSMNHLEIMPDATQFVQRPDAILGVIYVCVQLVMELSVRVKAVEASKLEHRDLCDSIITKHKELLKTNELVVEVDTDVKVHRVFVKDLCAEMVNSDSLIRDVYVLCHQVLAMYPKDSVLQLYMLRLACHSAVNHMKFATELFSDEYLSVKQVQLDTMLHLVLGSLVANGCYSDAAELCTRALQQYLRSPQDISDAVSKCISNGNYLESIHLLTLQTKFDTSLNMLFQTANKFYLDSVMDSATASTSLQKGKELLSARQQMYISETAVDQEDFHVLLTCMMEHSSQNSDYFLISSSSKNKGVKALHFNAAEHYQSMAYSVDGCVTSNVVHTECNTIRDYLTNLPKTEQLVYNQETSVALQTINFTHAKYTKMTKFLVQLVDSLAFMGSPRSKNGANSTQLVPKDANTSLVALQSCITALGFPSIDTEDATVHRYSVLLQSMHVYTLHHACVEAATSLLTYLVTAQFKNGGDVNETKYGSKSNELILFEQRLKGLSLALDALATTVQQRISIARQDCVLEAKQGAGTVIAQRDNHSILSSCEVPLLTTEATHKYSHCVLFELFPVSQVLSTIHQQGLTTPWAKALRVAVSKGKAGGGTSRSAAIASEKQFLAHIGEYGTKYNQAYSLVATCFQKAVQDCDEIHILGSKQTMYLGSLYQQVYPSVLPLVKEQESLQQLYIKIMGETCNTAGKTAKELMLVTVSLISLFQDLKW